MAFMATTTISTMLTHSFGQKRAASELIWPKSHVCMFADCCRSTPKSKLVHKKGLQNFGWESYMAFSSKHTIYCQADPQICPKMTKSRPILDQITLAHGCRQLQKHSKVKIGSQVRIMTTGMGIVHGFFIQTHHLLPN